MKSAVCLNLLNPLSNRTIKRFERLLQIKWGKVQEILIMNDEKIKFPLTLPNSYFVQSLEARDCWCVKVSLQVLHPRRQTAFPCSSILRGSMSRKRWILQSLDAQWFLNECSMLGHEGLIPITGRTYAALYYLNLSLL